MQELELESIGRKYITPGTAGIAMRMHKEADGMYGLDVVKYHKLATCGQNQY